MSGTPTLPTVLGITTELDIFDQTAGNDFTTNNAAIAGLGGVEGLTSSNHVLLGQFTTDGVFSFHLNLLIATPTPGVTQYFVSSSPETNEILDTTLNYTSGVIDNTGIEELQSNTPSFILYPNPTQDAIAIKTLNTNLSGSDLFDVQIIDMSGRTVINKTKHSLVDPINVLGLKEGIYTLKLMNGKDTSSLRLVKF
jgi:hypothetical protein